MNIKLAIYQPRASYYTGGGEIVPIEQAIALAERGNEVTFYTTRAPFIKESDVFQKLKDRANIAIKYIDVPNSLQWIYNKEAGEDWLRWDLESLHVGLLARDVIGRNDEKRLLITHLPLDLVARPTGMKVVNHIHGYPSSFSYHHKLIMTLADFFISDSNKIKKIWGEILDPCDTHIVLENGIDTDIFKPELVKTEYDLMYLGRLIENKGIADLLEAVSLLRSSKIRVAIAGDGPQKKQLTEIVNKMGLNSRVTFLGYVPEKNKKLVYNTAKVIVLPSRGKEGILTTALEAGSCGKPVITTRGSMEEIIDGSNGIIVRPSRPDELSMAINNILVNEELMERMGRYARNIILKNWSWKMKIVKTEEVYKNILMGEL